MRRQIQGVYKCCPTVYVYAQVHVHCNVYVNTERLTEPLVSANSRDNTNEGLLVVHLYMYVYSVRI